MPSKIKITDREVLREIKNGSDFSLNTSDSTTFLNGNTTGKVQIKYTIEAESYSQISNYEVFGNDTIIIRSGNFVDDGFKEGDTVYITVGDGSTGDFAGSGEIDFVTDDEMRLINLVQVDGGYAGPAGTIPNGVFSGQDHDYVFNTSDFLAMTYRFGLIENSESFNVISKISNVANEYKIGGLTGAFSPAAYGGTIKSGQSGDLEVRFVGKQDNPRFSSVGFVAQDALFVYETIHTFDIHPWYRDGEDEDLVAGIAPEDIAKGDRSLKYSIEVELRRTENDPTAPITARDDIGQNTGNVGWFNENLNNQPTQYSFSNVVYQNLTDSQPTDTIEVGKRTRISFLVNSSDGTFTANQPLVFTHSKRPQGSEYQTSNLTLKEVFVKENVRCLIDGPAIVTGDIIQSLQATLNSANEISVVAEIEFAAPEINQISVGDTFLTACEVEDDSLTNATTDATCLLISTGTYNVNTDIAGLWSWEEMDLYTHPVPFEDGVSEGFTDLQQWIEDGVMIDHGGSLNVDNGAFLESLGYGIAVYLDEDNFEFLDFTSFDLSGADSSADVPQEINIDTTRNYNLAEGDQFNFKKMSTGAYSAPNVPYSIQVAFKFPWQEWLAFNKAPDVFFDNTQPQNGKNKNTSRYSASNGYQIRFVAQAVVSKDGINTTYNKFSNDLRIRYYEQNDGTAPDWSCVTELTRENGSSTNGVVLTSEDTFVKVTYTPDVPFGPDPLLYWGAIRLEPINNPSFDIQELSSYGNQL